MKGALWVGVFALFVLLCSVQLALAASYAPTVRGSVQGYGLAGVEPDGDPLYRVVLQNRLPASGNIPAVNLIVSSYLENFKPDTTPVLPDLLHPKQDARNLGGFLQGKALLTDDAGNVLYLGSFLAEAFLDNTNHAVMTLYGSGSAFGGGGSLKGTFTLNKSGTLTGRFQGRLKLSAAAQRQIAANRGKKLRPIQQIIKAVTVVPHYYGTAGNKSSGPPLHTGFGKPAATGGSTHHLSPWTIVAAAGAAVSLLMAGVLFLIERRRAPPAQPAA
jgi:hypothetical protein